MSVRKKKANLLEALLPVIFLIVLLSINVFIFGDDVLSGSNQIVLILSAAVAAIVAIRLGFSYGELEAGIVRSIRAALSSILILLLIGSLAGTWLLSGVVPAMIYYGLKVMNANIFLFASCFICAVVSVASGSSWSTVATIGIALLGIGKTLGMQEGLVAGSIISGAYFGDKMSPLSDTTNLAPAMVGTDIFTHIRYMAYTTIPSISISLILYLVIGYTYQAQQSLDEIALVMEAIEAIFNVNLFLFLVPAIVIFMIVRKVAAIPALLAGTLLGGLFAVIFQPQIIQQVSGENSNYWLASYVAVMKAMYTDIEIVTGSEMVNELLSTSGMAGMLNTIWLIISAMVFGGVMESGGLLQRITEEVIKRAKSIGALIASTAGTCIFFNLTASDQYLAIVVPGRMYATTYRERGLKPENLSRTLEDAGTVTSVLVPWNTCGATQSAVLGVATIAYLPFCFFNLLSPIVTVIFGIFKIKLARYPEVQKMKKVETNV
jgi:NhaC family Na+:H+ antiporter